MDTGQLWQLVVVEVKHIGGEPCVVWLLPDVASPPIAGGFEWNPTALAVGAVDSSPMAQLWHGPVSGCIIGPVLWMALHGLGGSVARCGLLWQLGQA